MKTTEFYKVPQQAEWFMEARIPEPEQWMMRKFKEMNDVPEQIMMLTISVVVVALSVAVGLVTGRKTTK